MTLSLIGLTAPSPSAHPARRLRRTAWALTLLALPLLLTALGGECSLPDRSYATLRAAAQLASGAPPDAAVWSAPLPAAGLALAAQMGWPLAACARLLSALGWGGAALAINACAGPSAALLLATLPLALTGAGTPDALCVALSALSLRALCRQRRAWAALLIPACALTPTTLALTLALWIAGLRLPRLWRAAAISLIWGISLIGLQPPLLNPDSFGGVLPHASEFYWAYLPCLALGLRQLPGPARGWLALWSMPALLGHTADATTAALLLSAAVGLSGLGLESELRRRIVGKHPLLVFSAPLLAAHLLTLNANLAFIPVARCELEQQTGLWLRAHSAVDERVFASPRIGYFAARAVNAWPEREDPALWNSLLLPLAENPPDYCVAYTSLGWSRAQHSGWFEDYTLQATFAAPGEPTAPFTVWRVRPGLTARPIGAQIGASIHLLSAIAPTHAAPGAALPVTLYWQTHAPLAEDYTVFVHLISPAGTLAANHDSPPHNGWHPTRTWRPGEGIRDPHTLALPADLAPGSYLLYVGMYRWPSVERLPAWDRSGQAWPNAAIALWKIEVSAP